MANNYSEALKITVGIEGGYSDDPDDHGGATMYGVTQEVYDEWRESKGLEKQPVSQITPNEARQLYEEFYWNRALCPQMPNKVAIVMFDCAVNSGVGEAKKLLQHALKVEVDGHIGPATLAALNAADENDLTDEFLDVRIDFYEEDVRHDPSQAKFLNGWKNRVAKLRKLLLG